MQGMSLETPYKGYIFKSRTEYRWAVFFDTIGLSWFYEYEGFDLGIAWYLPDFYIPKWNCYFEVKNPKIFWNAITDNTELVNVIVKIIALSLFENKKTIIAFGDPDNSDGRQTPFVISFPGYNYLFSMIYSNNDVFIPINYIGGYGIIGKNTKYNIDIIHLLSCNYWNKKKPDDYIEAIIPLDHSIGLDFLQLKNQEAKQKAFIPFSNHLLCNLNANLINGYKSYNEAYIAAKNAKYGDSSVVINRK